MRNMTHSPRQYYQSAIAALALLMTPGIAAAQFELNAGYGFTNRQNDRPRRTFTDSVTDITDSPGEATTVWLRGSYWITDEVAVVASGTYMWDTSFFGGGLVPLPDFQINTTYLDGRIVYAPFGHEAGLGLELGFGPALILHGGTGLSELGRQTDVGISLSGAIRIHITGGLGMLLDSQLHWYSSQFGATSTSPAVSESQRDWTLSVGIGWRW